MDTKQSIKTFVTIAHMHNLFGVIAKREGDTVEAQYRFTRAARWLASARRMKAQGATLA
ncbi:hypothetical protein D3C81_1170390 [compost metagenome]